MASCGTIPSRGSRRICSRSSQRRGIFEEWESLPLTISTLTFLPFCPNIRYTKSTSTLEVFCHDLCNQMSTHALPSFSVIEPSVEGTHDAVRVDDLPADAKVGSHMHAICSQGIKLFVCASVDHDVVAVDIDRLDSFRWNLFGPGDVVPAIRVWRWRLPHVLLTGIELTLDEEMRFAKLEIVGQVYQGDN